MKNVEALGKNESLWHLWIETCHAH